MKKRQLVVALASTTLGLGVVSVVLTTYNGSTQSSTVELNVHGDCGHSVSVNAPEDELECNLYSNEYVRVTSIDIEIQGNNGSDRTVTETVNQTVTSDPNGLTLDYRISGFTYRDNASLTDVNTPSGSFLVIPTYGR